MTVSLTHLYAAEAWGAETCYILGATLVHEAFHSFEAHSGIAVEYPGPARTAAERRAIEYAYAWLVHIGASVALQNAYWNLDGSHEAQ